MKRRNFIKKASLAGIALPLVEHNLFLSHSKLEKPTTTFPVSITTWNFHEAGRVSGELLTKGTSALDAVQGGVMVEEANLENTTVGNGGSPDRSGEVTLDASIIGPDGNCGSVAYLKDIQHPILVARKVMEDTPHAFLTGEGAYNFAIQNGFEPQNLLTQKSDKKWKKWLEEEQYKPVINIENHDTIGMLAIDKTGDIAGACSTSGLAYKMPGRVGDSPIIGAGLYLDNEVGGAVATGMGEEIIKNVSSFLIVELMRQGKTPQQACEIAIERIIKRNPKHTEIQVGLLAINKKGEVGAYSIQPGFSFVLNSKGQNDNIQSESYF